MAFYQNATDIINSLKKRSKDAALTSRKLSKSILKFKKQQSSLDSINSSLTHLLTIISKGTDSIPLPNISECISIPSFHITDLQWANSKPKTAIVFLL